MLGALGLTLAFILIVTFVHAEFRSEWCGITLSNGMDVLVSHQMYREIVQQYRMLDEPDVWRRWDQAVLLVIRPERPLEWKLLVRSLRHPNEGSGRRREAVEA
jgi:hypothetical protein